MRYIYFFAGLIYWLIFAYDIEYDRGFMTWLWLFLSLFFFVNSYNVYYRDMKDQTTIDNDEDDEDEDDECNLCKCTNGIIECPACKEELEKDKLRCAGCKGKGFVTCGICGGKRKEESVNLNSIYLFKVEDYTTILLGTFDEKEDCFYVQRGDGIKYKYDSYRVVWKQKLKCQL